MDRLDRWCTHRAWCDRDVAHAVAVLAVAGAALATYRLNNPDKRVDHFYQRHHRGAYHALRISNFVLVVAVAFSARFLLKRCLSAGPLIWQRWKSCLRP